jgi:hypothetical protein
LKREWALLTIDHQQLTIDDPVMFRAVLILWASPGSLIGITAGLLSVAGGGIIRRSDHTLECHGPLLRWMLRRRPFRARAMTLGHVIIACDQQCLDATRAHERVHVRQYERWGPAFLPAYLVSSAWLWLRGFDPYLDNPFEVEAYNHDAANGDCRA